MSWSNSEKLVFTPDVGGRWWLMGAAGLFSATPAFLIGLLTNQVVAIVLFLALATTLVVRALRVMCVMDQAGIMVHNLLTSYKLDWTNVESFHDDRAYGGSGPALFTIWLQEKGARFLPSTLRNIPGSAPKLEGTMRFHRDELVAVQRDIYTWFRPQFSYVFPENEDLIQRE